MPKASSSFSRASRAAQAALELTLPRRRAEIFVGHHVHALGLREFLGARAHQHDVRRIFHDQARELDGILHVLQPADRAGAHCPAVHERGIEFGHAVAIQDSAASGVEQRVVLEDTYRGDRGVETRAAARQHGMAGTQRIFESRQVFRLLGRFHVFAGQRARPTVNGDREHFSSVSGMAASSARTTQVQVSAISTAMVNMARRPYFRPFSGRLQLCFAPRESY